MPTCRKCGAQISCYDEYENAGRCIPCGGGTVSWRELNPIYWRKRLREAHAKPRRHPHRTFTAAELRQLRRTLMPYDLRVLRAVVHKNLGRM